MRYFKLTKPGIIFGNIITLLGGFLLASHSGFMVGKLLAAMLGMALVIACGCVINNFIDSDIDKVMERTKNRPTAKDLIPGKNIFFFALALGLGGTAVLYFFTNILTTIIALIGLFFYVVVYTLWLKRRSIYGTLVGGIAGAVPPVIGYCTLTNQFDLGALTLFFILFFWQVPHSYAIGIFRLKDYTAANIPILPIKKGIHFTKISMLLYIIGFTFAAMMPTFLGYTNLVYLIVALLIGLTWFIYGLKGLTTHDDQAWARKMFIISIVIIMTISFMMVAK